MSKAKPCKYVEQVVHLFCLSDLCVSSPAAQIFPSLFCLLWQQISRVYLLFLILLRSTDSQFSSSTVPLSLVHSRPVHIRWFWWRSLTEPLSASACWMLITFISLSLYGCVIFCVFFLFDLNSLAVAKISLKSDLVNFMCPANLDQPNTRICQETLYLVDSNYSSECQIL